MKVLAAAGTLLPCACVAALIAHPAAAQLREHDRGTTRFRVEVERDPLASACPDATWFQARIASHAGTALAGSFALTFTKLGESWRASILRRDDRGATAERTLKDRGPACEPLAEAVALTVAILADDSAPRAEAQVPTRGAEAVESIAPQPQPLPDSRVDEPGLALWLGADTGVATSLIAAVAPLLGASVALESSRFRAGLRVMLTPEQTFELDPGSVAVQASLATLLGCFVATARPLEAGLCAAADAGLLRGRASGFDRERPRTRTYQALGLEAQPSLLIGPRFRLTLGVALLRPFRQESFSVSGRGTAYRPPSLNFRAVLLAEIGVFR